MISFDFVLIQLLSISICTIIEDFDSAHSLLEYKILLSGSNRNCNGGKTAWDTWISCEEDDNNNGRVWQIDPLGVKEPVQITHGSQGGSWETFAHDTRDASVLYAFLSEDREDGAVQRMTISNPDYANAWDILLNSGPVDYLYLEPTGDFSGTFKWITNEVAARENARFNYPSTEGMETDGNVLYLISKELNGFFSLNLDAGAYTFEETGFDGQPDQSTTIVQEDGSKLTFFTEEAQPPLGCVGKQVGIWTRDEASQYVNILYGDDLSPGKLSRTNKPQQVSSR